MSDIVQVVDSICCQEGSPGAQSPGQRRSLLSGQLHSGELERHKTSKKQGKTARRQVLLHFLLRGTSPEPSEAEVVGNHRLSSVAGGKSRTVAFAFADEHFGFTRMWLGG